MFKMIKILKLMYCFLNIWRMRRRACLVTQKCDEFEENYMQGVSIAVMNTMK